MASDERATRQRGLIIRLTPSQTETLTEAWKEMRKLGIHTDAGETLHDALRNELLNIVLRWGDNIIYAKEGHEAEVVEQSRHNRKVRKTA